MPLVAHLSEREKEIIEAALAESQGQVSGPTGAAAKLGIPRQTLEWKIRRLGIDGHRFKTAAAAERLWSPNYIQHSAHIEPGREGLINLIKSLPPTLKYEPGTIVAEGDLVIVHG